MFVALNLRKNNLKRFLFLLICFACEAAYLSAAESPLRVRVYLRNKGPEQALCPDAVSMQVYAPYVALLKRSGLKVRMASKWFNMISGWASEQSLAGLERLGCVHHIEVLKNHVTGSHFLSFAENEAEESRKVKLAREQLEALGSDTLRKLGWNGSGVRIAIFDGGFPRVDRHPAFGHLMKGNRIVGTYDFVKHNPQVYAHNLHGTAVLSNVAGMYEQQPLGLATGAQFLLARTEQSREPFSEEENWLAAAEWADSLGADIISSSLGYGIPRYFPEWMDGQHSLVARAARMAVRRGILVVNSAGNEGDESWTFLVTPGDVDSVLTVGGIDPEGGYHIGFSSYGPAFDGSLKPELCAFGQTTCALPRGYGILSGTSFSAPLLTGFAACMLQGHPEWKRKPMELKRYLCSLGSLFPHADYAHGYGVPALRPAPKTCDQPQYFVSSDTLKVEFSWKGCTVDDGNLLYWALQEPGSAKILRYQVVRMEEGKPLRIPLSGIKPGSLFSFSWKRQRSIYTFAP